MSDKDSNEQAWEIVSVLGPSDNNRYGYSPVVMLHDPYRCR
ncbi:uncharacterized protein ARMOST_14771 [Armillaria ostoyae]|uniref:Uncharacterized protein n=1 Tax=Armillaria ostoyae TaxID=47428 RepID=A0A284RRL6_ARMOS|nr:uncharacterized protein ARMOST_14771 [Armillaria ostoyae]